MDKKITGIKLNFIKNIGDMSEKKIELFIKEFSDEFPGKNNIANGLLLTKNIGNATVKSLFLVQNQVTYGIEGENVEPNFYEPENFAKRIFDKLYLDYKCTVVCNYSCLVKSDDIFESLKNKMDFKLKDDEKIQGVGFKIFINNDLYTGNFVFEPFLRDEKYMFCSLEIQIIKVSSLKEIVKEAEKIFNGMFDELVEQSYSNIKKLGE